MESKLQTLLEYVRENITGTYGFTVIFYVAIFGTCIYLFFEQYYEAKDRQQIKQRLQQENQEDYFQKREKLLRELREIRQKEQEKVGLRRIELTALQEKSSIRRPEQVNGRPKIYDFKKNKQLSLTMEQIKEKYRFQKEAQGKIKTDLRKKIQEDNRIAFEKEQRLKEQKIKEQRLKEQKIKEQRLKEQKIKEQRLKEQRLRELKLRQQKQREQKLLNQQTSSDGSAQQIKDKDKETLSKINQKMSTIHVILQQPDQQSQATLSKQHSNTLFSNHKLNQEPFFQIPKADKASSNNVLNSMNGAKSQDASLRFNQSSKGLFGEKDKQSSFKMTNSIVVNNGTNLLHLAALPKQTPSNNSAGNSSIFNNKPIVPNSNPLSFFGVPNIPPKTQEVESKGVQIMSEVKKQENKQSKQSNNVMKKDHKEKIEHKSMKLSLSPMQYFEGIIKYALKQTVSAKITTVFSNLGGPKSSLNDVLTFATSFVSSIKKEDDKQLTSFALQTYDSIIYLIKVANQRDGIYRIPPKQKSGQVQKNSINNYVLMINLYRLMGYEKIWMIFFGKLLKELEFLFKREEELKSYLDFQLVKNGHMDVSGELQGRILSRMDNLIYALLALTAFDPLLIFKYIEKKDQEVRPSREQIESWGRQWSYKEFWILMDLILKKKNNFYFKPIIYINLLYVLYPRIYENKLNKTKFIHEANLYMTIIDESKQFFSKISSNVEMQELKKNAKGDKFTYDGGSFYDGIKVLEARLCVQKVKEYKTYSLDEFEKKCNTLYYFCKEK